MSLFKVSRSPLTEPLTNWLTRRLVSAGQLQRATSVWTRSTTQVTHQLGYASEMQRPGCMCMANLDNDPSGESMSLVYVSGALSFGAVKVATGSFQGVLRIYKPKNAEFGVEDLLYEEQYDEPILQVGAGVFSR